MTTPAAADTIAPKENVKETLISILIAFVLAFVARGFVIEAFIIPTGSMAPTLLGAHMRFVSPQTGNTWAVGPWVYPTDAAGQIIGESPYDLQSPPDGRGGSIPITVRDPMSGEELKQHDVPTRAGDRIMVLKYLYDLREPERFDVVVFKNPSLPGQNYIKRLVGLPGEQIAIVDGDVFTRPSPSSAPDEHTWDEPGWQIQRKPLRVQRSVWQPVYDSARAPASPDRLAGFAQPWACAGGGRALEGSRAFEFSAPGTLTWSSDARFTTRSPTSLEGSQVEAREITDRYAYNEGTPGWQGRLYYPVSDVRVGAVVTPAGDDVSLSATLRARGHEFRGVFAQGHATIQTRPQSAPGENEQPWQDVASGAFTGFAPGRDTGIELWHYDQQVILFADDQEIARYTYDWSPAQRIEHATGRRLEQILANPSRAHAAQPLGDPALYRRCGVSWSVQSGACRLSHVRLDRDLFYVPGTRANATPGTATHPTTSLRLQKDQFFMCGDNSPASLDSRLWTDADPWVKAELEPTVGVVNRRLLLGKAFFVYFPAMTGGSPVPTPDFGRMRFIQ